MDTKKSCCTGSRAFHFICLTSLVVRGGSALVLFWIIVLFPQCKLHRAIFDRISKSKV
jgi:hypothetical protein